MDENKQATERVRFQISIALFAVVRDRGRWLAIRRSGTGWMDDHWSLPAGAYDGNEGFVEGALRELKEETGLLASVVDCRLLHVQQVFGGPREWTGIYVGVEKFSGLPTIMEPDKHDRLEWRDLMQEGEPVVPYVAAAIREISLGSNLSAFRG